MCQRYIRITKQFYRAKLGTKTPLTNKSEVWSVLYRSELCKVGGTNFIKGGQDKNIWYDIQGPHETCGDFGAWPKMKNDTML